MKDCITKVQSLPYLLRFQRCEACAQSLDKFAGMALGAIPVPFFIGDALCLMQELTQAHYRHSGSQLPQGWLDDDAVVIGSHN